MVLTVLFFSWVGTLADIGWVIQHIPQVAGLAAAIVGIKSLVAAASLRVFGLSWRATVPAGMSTAQLGEFSFAVFALAFGLELIDFGVFQLMVSASIVTILLSPSVTALGVRAMLADRSRGAVAPPIKKARARILVVGLGPAGLKVCEALVDAGANVVAMELNPRPAETSEEVEVVFGDAASEEVLLALGPIAACIVTIPDPRGCIAVVSSLRRTFPDAGILSRVRYHLYVDEVRDAGADTLVDEEYQVGDVLAACAVERFVDNDGHARPGRGRTEPSPQQS
jgi:CPA2 family monovalent cation:H+ antiporter-2